MKINIKALVMIIISIFLVMLVNSYSYAWNEATLNKGPLYDTKADAYHFSSQLIGKYDNIYCIQEGYLWRENDGQKWWKLKKTITIDGDVATVGKKTYYGAYDETYGVTDNQLLASILYNGKGYGNSPLVYSKAQKALYAYIGTWVKNSKISMSTYVAKNYKDEYLQELPYYAELAKINKYKVIIYYFEVGDGYQNLIMIHRENKEKSNAIKVTKNWDDDKNIYRNRPESIKVTLRYVETGEIVTKDASGGTIENPRYLSESNNWTTTFDNLNDPTNYEIKEEEVSNAYISENTGDSNVLITNKLKKVKFKIQKEWEDLSNYYKVRPSYVNVKLMRKSIDGSVQEECVEEFTLNEKNNWIVNTSEFPAYIEGHEMKYWLEEETQYYTAHIDCTETYENNITTYNYTITNVINQSTEISGKVWLDKPNGKGNDIDGEYKENSQDQLLEGIKVSLIDKDNKTILAQTTTQKDGTYILKATGARTYSNNVYVEFEYDGMKYTTVKTSVTGKNTSKAKETETTKGKTREEFDYSYTKVTNKTKHPDEWTDQVMKASTEGIIKFEEYTENKIENINLGLFEREQPDVAIFSDLTKVEVEMNKQKYTYLYGVRGSDLNNVGLQAKFQNKDTYTYKRPVNPADIAYLREESNKTAMSVVVTYEVKVANLSTTLQTTINEITNYFDKQYTLNTEGWTVTEGLEFNKATKGNLNITLQPQTQSSAIELKYTVSIDVIKGLLDGEAALNNAVEIESFSTMYGENTLYAEQRAGERTSQPYAGYDYNSKPGNANIQLKTGEDGIQRLYSTDANENIIPTNQVEDDTDIAPSFVLCLDAPKTISGIVWEDENIKTDGQRIGDGIRQDSENKVKNVKIELYNADGTIAKIYNNETKKLDKDAVIYTGEDGSYKLEGLVTGKEYFIKYTYGDDISLGKINATDNKPTTIIGNDINARNYKSTVITEEYLKDIMKKTNLEEEDKKWPLKHNERYSVAVDYMIERLNISELKNSTYNDPVNMTAYTKVFILSLENDNQDDNGLVESVDGTIKGITKELNKFDFGIIERPREELIVQKTISYFKVSLANGQVLTEGNPNDSNANIKYTNVIGFKDITTSKEALIQKLLGKRLLIEVDSELIQGAQLEATYEVKIINNNEIDSDYGENDDYKDIANGKNQYISKSTKAEYYYFGTGDITPIDAKIKFVDYLSSDLIYNTDTNTWNEIDGSNKLKELDDGGFIAKDLLTELKQGKYRVLVPNGGSDEISGQIINIPRGETSSVIQMTTSKLLSLKDDNTFYNHAEIIEIDAKTARTIKGKDENGEQIEYKPGNYIPTTLANSELDNDSVNITITPPTGIINYIITYIIVGLMGLLLTIVTIVFIKKKVLIK